MTPRKKVTDATKAKLPLPKGHPQRKSGKRYRFVDVTCSWCKNVACVRGVIGKVNVHDCACGHSNQFRPLSDAEIRRAQDTLNVDRHPQQRPTRKRPKGTAPSFPERVQCPNCEKWVRPGPLDFHPCYDAKALREDRHLHPEPSPIAGQPIPPDLGSQPAPTFEAVPFSFGWVDKHTKSRPVAAPRPDPKAYPWPLRFAWWIDGWLAKLAQRFQ